MNEIRIIPYQPCHQPYFEKFNRQWIEKYFWLEEIDRLVLQNPEAAILGEGGDILIATCDGVISGTVALRRLSDTVFELTKMAVDEAFRRKGIAEALSKAALEKAADLGAVKVILYSQTGLAAAISI